VEVPAFNSGGKTKNKRGGLALGKEVWGKTTEKKKKKKKVRDPWGRRIREERIHQRKKVFTNGDDWELDEGKV